MRWWESLYDGLLAAVLLEPQTEDELARTADFVWGVLELAPGARVFDQCCGLGQLARVMASRGAEVIGVDQASAYVERARRDAEGLRARFEVGDAFAFVAEPACDGAYNWWTSYGYADDDAENERMLARAFESLRPGARYALDVPNVPGLLRGFLPSVVTRRAMPEGELVLIRESSIDLAKGVLHKRWTYVLPDGGMVVRPSAVRLYMPHDMRAAFERAGFEEVALYGSTAGERLALDSPRCIVVGRRPR